VVESLNKRFSALLCWQLVPLVVVFFSFSFLLLLQH